MFPHSDIYLSPGLQKSPFREGARRKFLTALLAGVMLVPAGCGQVGDTFSRTGDEAQVPVDREVSSGAGGQSRANNAAQPTSTQRPATTSQSPNGLARPKGLVDNRRLFDQPVSDPIARIRRIELAVQDLRDDFDTAIPAMAGLIVSESELTQVLEDLKRSGEISYTDITPPESANTPRNPLEPVRRPSASQNKNVGAIASAPPTAMRRDEQEKIDADSEIEKTQIEERQIEQAEPSTQQQAKPKPEPDKAPVNVAKKKEAPKPDTKAEQTEYSQPHVVKVRFGTYPDKTRIVLDLSAPAAGYSVDLDNSEKILVLEVKGAKWDAREKFSFKDSKLLSSFTAQDKGANGSRLLIALKQPVEVLNKFALKAAGPKKDRIVLDIGPE